MVVYANIFSGLNQLINFVISLYVFAVLIRVVLSWIPHDHNNTLIRFIYDITEPVLAKIRQFIPPFAGLDLSPMILIIGLLILKSFFN